VTLAPPAVIAVLALAGFFAGVVDAIAGGGGLITLPSLLAVGLPTHVALATNKGQSTFGCAAAAASFWARGAIDRGRAPISFAGGLVGAVIGSRLLLAVPAEPLRPVVLVLLVAAAAVVLLYRPKPASAPPPGPAPPASTRAPTASSPAPSPAASVPRKLRLALVALGMGLYDGFFGPGVGSMLIVAFVLAFGDNLTRASGNAKVVNLASNVAALAVFVWSGRVLWSIAIPMAVGNALGSAVGARLALRVGDRLVRATVLFVVFALVAKVALDLRR
jgi:uncharacterized membrane protein YfcA